MMGFGPIGSGPLAALPNSISVEVEPERSGPGGITFAVSVPPEIRMHLMHEHELKDLANMSRPIMLALAGMSGGALISLAPLAFDAFVKLSRGPIPALDVFVIVVTILMAGLALISWPLAIYGQIATTRQLARIRERPVLDSDITVTRLRPR